MDSVFKYDNYKLFLNNYVTHKDAPRGLRSAWAKAMGCQAAYLSHVLKSNAELTEDHTFKLTQYLQFSKTEAAYLMTLVRMARAGTPELRKYLEKERQEILAETKKTLSRLDSKVAGAEEFTKKYFSSWVPSTVHIATSEKKFQTIEALALRLGLSEALVLETMQFLEEHKLVKKEGTKNWVFAGSPLYLPKETSENNAFQLHRRLQVMKSIQQDAGTENIHFSSVFTLDKASYEKVRQLLLESIEKSHKTIHAGGTEEIYGMCIDLYEIV
jgi:uncharacterized protein (TIGR02147 family)